MELEGSYILSQDVNHDKNCTFWEENPFQIAPEEFRIKSKANYSKTTYPGVHYY